ncbi:MAG: aminotransferase [Curvibacter sp. RIFCSPHIGHO2_12_FULL_63_18]|uniref:aminotransferase class I/II-fold pyridoxal phosphate-dependent enzyme n=1 Tax=Rhodoferax sp. TaxID=50421 RepID=UPI0008B69DA5|nr:aminotransferase class I/II-fold pyridoxal phosphate-dependent enzyme [Rhodoferax sp.]OGO96997.1 MAG: aminotransferase [Curvibacter sp. GWA2_63_95]OGP01174.1 MAG: aminotransferase [Curvibacter sp. RIFCSPHIGHO2_12_FULL_63_18]HCX79985.1 aminotransferase [Rhodoferax sp.]
MSQAPRIHGGPDALGAPRYDFSTNSNACGPCPQALAAVQAADATRYPDASYTALRAALADFYAVAPWRIVLAGSASEFIFRISAWARRQGARTVSLPTHAYGDYAHAAQAWGLQVVADGDLADLAWACEPSSPLGQAHSPMLTRVRGTVVLDSAYAPLRLSGQPTLGDSQRQQLWQLFSPNKALGLTGVRAAFAIAPLGAEAAVQQMEALAPSWVLGAHGVAMLTAWTQPDTQAWLQASLVTLAAWKQRQTTLLHAAGWTLQTSDTPFFCARPPAGVDAAALCATLRAQGIKLRDATSFGLSGWVRLGVLPPAAVAALVQQLLHGD